MASHGRVRVTAGLAFALAAGAGCATDWKQTSSYERALETVLEVFSEPSADLYVNGENAGPTPVSLLLRYREEVAIDERRVSFFRSSPLDAIVVAISSLGFTVPLHVLPTDHDSRDRPLHHYAGADFDLELRREGFEPWNERLSLSGEPTLRLESKLTRVAPDHSLAQQESP